MYTGAELQGLERQIRKRLMILAAIGLPLLGGVIAGFVTRLELLADGCAIGLGALLIGGLDLAVFPLRRYARHVDAMLHGHAKVSEAVFLRMGEEKTDVNGVDFFPVTVTTSDPESGKSFEHLYYFDCLKPRPDWREGQPLRITHVGRSIVSAEAAD